MLERLTLELTTKCNLRCIHCFQEHDPYSTMDTKLALSLINEANKLNFGQIVLTGGEPTLHRDFSIIYRHARSLGFIINIFTNATVIPVKVKKIITNMPPHIVSITLYGLDQDTFYTMTGRRLDFNKALDNVKFYKKLGSDVVLRFHALTVTKKSISAFIKFAKSVSCDYGVNVQVIPRLNGKDDNLNYRLSPKEIKEIESKYNFDFIGHNPTEVPIRECDLGDNAYITANGKLQGCPIYTSLFETVDNNNLKEQMQKLSLAGNYVRKQRHLNRGVCPAWLHLEGTKAVKSFLNNLGAKDL